MKGLFIGNIIDNKFKLSLTSKVFSTRTRLPFNITGVVTDNLIEVKYQIPYFILLITFAFPIIDFILINGTSNFNGVLYLIAGLIIISYGIKIIRTRQIFKRICKKA